VAAGARGRQSASTERSPSPWNQPAASRSCAPAPCRHSAPETCCRQLESRAFGARPWHARPVHIVRTSLSSYRPGGRAGSPACDSSPAWRRRLPSRASRLRPATGGRPCTRNGHRDRGRLLERAPALATDPEGRRPSGAPRREIRGRAPRPGQARAETTSGSPRPGPGAPRAPRHGHAAPAAYAQGMEAEGRQGRAQGLANAAQVVGSTLGPLASGLLFDLSPIWPYALGAGMLLPGLGASCLLAPKGV
jgi:hypothetical protein